MPKNSILVKKVLVSSGRCSKYFSHFITWVLSITVNKLILDIILKFPHYFFFISNNVHVLHSLMFDMPFLGIEFFVTTSLKVGTHQQFAFCCSEFADPVVAEATLDFLNRNKKKILTSFPTLLPQVFSAIQIFPA